jgi:O-antigen/teichoic acid export membrane protein
LIFAATALVLLSITTGILTAAGHIGLTLALTGPLPLLAFIGYLALIPRQGPKGAAVATLVAVASLALTSAIVVVRICHMSPPSSSLFRSLLLSVFAYAAATLWATPGFLVGVKLLALSVGIVLAYGLFGEFTRDELRAGRALLRRRRPSTP